MYAVRFFGDAIDDLKILDKTTVRRIMRRLQWLAENFEDVKPRWLRGELSGLAKLREGNYRIIYQPIESEQVLIIHSVGHRREVYKR